MVIDDLIEIAEKELSSRKKHVIRCCMAAGCISSDSKGVKEALEKAVKEAGLEDQVEVRGVGCMKLCCQGPLVQVDTEEQGATVEIQPAGQGPLYQKVTPEEAASVIGTLKGGKTEVQVGDPKSPFFAEQLSIVLANSGHVDPERIESYIAADGYDALHDVLRERTPKEVVDLVTRSGLRGRGGAGFPTGLKWSTVAKTASQQKYVICNADEGDPGAFMDRSVLESDPHSILEGMTIAAYAVGASQGFIYVRAEYPLAISRLSCQNCDTRIETELSFPALMRLPRELQKFVLLFLRCRSGIPQAYSLSGSDYRKHQDTTTSTTSEAPPDT